MNIFSSIFFKENTAKFSQNRTLASLMLNQHKKAEYALSYYLEKALPKGGTVCVMYPKSILENLLPKAAISKGCNIVVLGGYQGFVHKMLEHNIHTSVTAKLPKADLYITEPEGITAGGMLVPPEEAEMLQQVDVLPIASILQWTTKNPASHDFLPTTKITTELGTHPAEHTEETITSASSWISPLTPFPASQLPFPIL